VSHAIVAKLDAAPEGVLDVAPILALHRGQDGYVAFVRKPAEPTYDQDGKPRQFENLFSVPVAELREMFPALATWLVKDAYFGVNTYYRAAPYANKLTGLPDVWRKETQLRYLNACYADLDVGREADQDPHKRQSWWQALALAGELMEKGHLPMASIFARSGQGVYLFWILRDEKDARLPPKGDARHYPEVLALYKVVNKAIASRLAPLAADRAAHDGARVLRVPGTLHGKVHRHAKYLIAFDDNGKGYTYTLAEMARFFGVVETAVALPDGTRQAALTTPRIYGRPVIARGTVPTRKKGAISRNAQRAQDLLTLEQYRQGWPKGRRQWHLETYASFLRLRGEAPQDTLKAVRVMAANCKPPYPSDLNDEDIHHLVERVYRTGRKLYSNAKLCKWLGVTPELARSLPLLTIVPPEVKAERHPPGGPRAADREARRAALKDWISEHGIPRGACRAFEKRILPKQYGIEASRTTVARDLREMGYEVTAGPGRPKVGR